MQGGGLLVATAGLSFGRLLIMFHHSLLVIGFFTWEDEVRCWRAGGWRTLSLSFSNISGSRRRSIHDIRLNEYMNSNASRADAAFLTNGPRGLGSGWLR